MITIGLTGESQTGKDEFIAYLETVCNVNAVSWVDLAKKTATYLGLTDARNEEHRAFLSDLVLTLDKKDLCFRHVMNNLSNKVDVNIIVFRTPEQCTELQEAIDDIMIVKLERDVICPNNYGDNSVKFVKADIVIENNADLGEFYFKVERFHNRWIR